MTAGGEFHGEAEVEIPGGEWASVTGRNGTFTPTSVRIWQGNESAWVEAIGARNNAINGGIALPVESMDALAMRWLQSRGLVMPATCQKKAGEARIIGLEGEQDMNRNTRVGLWTLAPLFVVCAVCVMGDDMFGWQFLGGNRSTLVSADLVDGKVHVVRRTASGTTYCEGGGPPDTIAKEIYAASNGVVVLERTVKGTIVPPSHTRERIEWPDAESQKVKDVWKEWQNATNIMGSNRVIYGEAASYSMTNAPNHPEKQMKAGK